MLGLITQITAIASIVLWVFILSIFMIITVRNKLQQRRYGGNVAKTKGQEEVINEYHGTGLQ